MEPSSGLSGVVSAYCPVSYTLSTAPRDLSTQKWFDSTVRSEPETMDSSVDLDGEDLGAEHVGAVVQKRSDDLAGGNNKP